LKELRLDSWLLAVLMAKETVELSELPKEMC
jgi:hypothetical protein